MTHLSPWRRRTRLAAAALAVGTLTACGGSDVAAPSAAPVGALGLVIGAHANAPAPRLLGDLAEVVERAALAGADMAVVLNAGRPEVLWQGPTASGARNASAQERHAAKVVASLTNAVTTSTAENPESNLLSSLDLAGRSLAGTAGPKTLLVVDSGLQTTDVLRFQDPGMLAADPAETVAYLASTDALPDLTGVEVVFSGLGDTAPPQEPLAPAQRRNLVAIWSQIAEAAGAASVEVLDAPLPGVSADGLPPVTPVPVPPAVPRIPPAAPSVPLTEEVVAFLPDSAEYREPQVVQEALRPLADRIRAAGSAVRLTGTTSSAGTPAGRTRLALARADAVKTSLVALGVPADLVSTAGVGSDWPGYVQDKDAAGNLLPGPAARNRSVVVDLVRAR